MSRFTIAIVERAPVRTAGMKVRATMARAAELCPALWQNDFGPRMCSFPADPARPGESYGLSVMVDSDAFDYWAVMPLADGAPAPEGMDIFPIPGGLYAECKLLSLKELGDAYNYVYGEWPESQDKYALNMQGVSLELYTPEFMKTGELTIYCPLVEK